MYFLSILGHLITECRVYVLVKYSMKNRGLTYVIKSCTKERSSFVTRKPIPHTWTRLGHREMVRLGP